MGLDGRAGEVALVDTVCISTGLLCTGSIGQQRYSTDAASRRASWRVMVGVDGGLGRGWDSLLVRETV